MLELLAHPIPAVSWKEAPAVWEQSVGRGLLPGSSWAPGPFEGRRPAELAGQAGIMAMTQPKRRLTSSTQRGGCSSGSTQHSGSMASLPELEGRQGCLPEALSQGSWAPAATLSGRTSCPPSGHPTPPPSRRRRPHVAVLPPGSQGSAPQWARAGVGAGAGAQSLVLEKVTPGQCSLYLSPAPPLPRARGCSCLQPAPLLPATLVSVLSTPPEEGCNGLHLLKAYVSSLGQVASCPWTLSHWLCVGLQIRKKAAGLQLQPPLLLSRTPGCRALAGSRGLG